MFVEDPSHGLRASVTILLFSIPFLLASFLLARFLLVLFLLVPLLLARFLLVPLFKGNRKGGVLDECATS